MHMEMIIFLKEIFNKLQ